MASRQLAGGIATGALLAALLLFGACGGKAPADNFYRLEVPAPPTERTQPVLSGTLQVDRFRTDALTRERSILHVEEAGSLHVAPYSYHLWTDTPTVMLQRALAEYARQAGLADRVVTPEMNVDNQWVLNGWIEQLVHVRGSSPGKVVVELELALSRSRGGDQLLRQRYRIEKPTSGDDVADAVQAFNSAVTAIFAQFEADLAAAT